MILPQSSIKYIYVYSSIEFACVVFLLRFSFAFSHSEEYKYDELDRCNEDPLKRPWRTRRCVIACVRIAWINPASLPKLQLLSRQMRSVTSSKTTNARVLILRLFQSHVRRWRNIKLQNERKIICALKGSPYVFAAKVWENFISRWRCF